MNDATEAPEPTDDQLHELLDQVSMVAAGQDSPEERAAARAFLDQRQAEKDAEAQFDQIVEQRRRRDAKIASTKVVEKFLAAYGIDLEAEAINFITLQRFDEMQRQRQLNVATAAAKAMYREKYGEDFSE